MYAGTHCGVSTAGEVVRNTQRVVTVHLAHAVDLYTVLRKTPYIDGISNSRKHSLKILYKYKHFCMEI